MVMGYPAVIVRMGKRVDFTKVIKTGVGVG